MRREFEKKLSRRPDLQSKIRLLGGDARSFDIGRPFAAAFLSGCFDHFLDDAERVASLANIGRHLTLNGILVFDVFLGLMEDQPPTPAGVAELEGKEIRRYVGGKVLPDNTKRINLVFEVYQGGRLIERIEEDGLVGITSRDGVHHVLRAAGFEVRGEWSSYDFTPFRNGDTLLLVEAAKSS
jgi:hypothetical protein